MAPIALEDAVLPDRTKEPSNSDAHPYVLAINQIQAAITRHREYMVSTTQTSDGSAIIEDSYRSQSPVGFTNDAKTIEAIEKVLDDLDRTYPHPKHSHDSSKIDEDLAADSNGQVLAPLPAVEAPWPIRQDVTSIRTHPESFEPYDHHIDKIATFENDLMKAWNNSKEAEVKYTTVEVLLLTWEANPDDDDIREEVDADTKELVELFREVNYTITSFAIPRDKRKCRIRLQKKLLQFVEKYENHKEEDVLFLVHYNGHGSLRNGKSYWHPTAFAARRSDPYDLTSDQNGPTIEYDDVRKIFDSVENQDILFILDCCYAGAASRSKGSGNTKELLAACGSEDRTPAENSFTSRFVKCFREQLKMDEAFQVGWLFQSITNISQKPTPLHVNLNKSPTSICLSSLASTKREDVAVLATGLSNDSLSPSAMLGVDEPSSATSSKALSTFSNDNDVSDINTRPTSAQGGPLPDHWNYEVLITVKLHGDIVPDKRGWHLDFPATQVQGIKTVKVRSVVWTKSTLLLVTMPIRCWVLLPDHPAYTFIDFVRTDTYLNGPDNGPNPVPSPPPAIGPVERSDSDSSAKAPDHLPHIIAAIKDFFENKQHHESKEKANPIRRISSRIGLHSSHRFENDPRFGYVRHIMQSLVVISNEHDESSVSYDLHFREEKKLFERCKKHLIKEVLHNAGSNNKNKIESTVTAELDQLEREVLELVEVDKKRPKIEPRVPSEPAKATARPQSQHKQRPSVISKHEPIPEYTEVAEHSPMLQRAETGLPRTESSVSMKRIPRTDSMQSKHENSWSDARPLLSFLGRKFSRDSGRSNTPVQSPMTSPRISAHLSSGVLGSP